jgi:hypothetical protein
MKIFLGIECLIFLFSFFSGLALHIWRDDLGIKERDSVFAAKVLFWLLTILNAGLCLLLVK